MEELKNKLFVIIFILLIINSNAYSQNSDKKFIGKWRSIKPYKNTVMELSFEDDKSYTEIMRNNKSHKIESIYKAHFVIINDSIIFFKGKSIKDNHLKFKFTGSNLIRFYPIKKELRESIPLIYLFTFKKIN